MPRYCAACGRRMQPLVTDSSWVNRWRCVWCGVRCEIVSGDYAGGSQDVETNRFYPFQNEVPLLTKRGKSRLIGVSEMQVQVTLNLADPKQMAAFDALRAAHTGAKVETVTAGKAEEKPAKRGPGRPPKAKVEETDDDEIGGDVEEEDEEETEADEEEDDDDVIDDAQKKKLQTALRKFAESKGETGKSAAVKVLKKFAETTSKVKKSQFDDLLKKLKVA